MQKLSATLTSAHYATFRDRLWTRCFEPTRGDQALLPQILETDRSLIKKSDKHLAELADQLRTRSGNAETASQEEILVAALGLAKNAIRRSLSMEAYDVQVLAGIAMSRGAIAEMQTGEGKTLTSVFPIIFHSLRGRGVHVATVNAYLAERDAEFLRPVFELLGFSVGVSKDGAATEEKRAAYACDITFATGYELGFDFLRDQLALMADSSERLGEKLRRELSNGRKSAPNVTQRSHAIAIIDEIDSVLIDEAITPLVLSSGSFQSSGNDAAYHAAKAAAQSLQEGIHFQIVPKTKQLHLTEAGSKKVHRERDQFLGAQDQYRLDDQKDPASRIDRLSALVENEISQENTRVVLARPWRNYVEAALRAKHIMQRDIQYVVRDEKIEIVDEYTGRIFSDRNWRDGLHQAVETKENLPITEEKKTLAKISRQRYFQKYESLCGMTGTASGHQRELLSFYGLPIVVIPLRKPSQRVELATQYFSNIQEKSTAIVEDVRRRQATGQPILIGTRTIQQSRMLAEMLARCGIVHQILNGVQDADEATLISKAGQAGCITVATNMAGRGTDIKPARKALSAGGLHVIGFERNSSSRIDRQLLGRSGRQGDIGSGQFFVSAEDDLIERYDSSLASVLRRFNRPADRSSSDFDKRILGLQALAEKESYEVRCNVMRQELWLDDVKKSLG